MKWWPRVRCPVRRRGRSRRSGGMGARECRAAHLSVRPRRRLRDGRRVGCRAVETPASMGPSPSRFLGNAEWKREEVTATVARRVFTTGYVIIP